MRKFLLLGIILSAATLLSAQTKEDVIYNPIITGVPSLSISPDAVGGAMGDVGVASKPTLASQFWNSSKYAMMDSKGGLTLSYTPWLRKIVNDVDLVYLAGYYNISEQFGTLSASLRYFSLGNITLRDYNGTELGNAKPYEMSFDLGYSRRLAEYFSMGVALRGTSRLGLGFNISNIGSKISYNKGVSSNFMPTNLGIGASYLFPFDAYNRIALNVDLNKLMVPSRRSKYATGFNQSDPATWAMSDKQYSEISVVKGIFTSFSDAPGGFSEELKEISVSTGLEYAYNEQFFVRAGYHGESKRAIVSSSRQVRASSGQPLLSTWVTSSAFRKTTP